MDYGNLLDHDSRHCKKTFLPGPDCDHIQNTVVEGFDEAKDDARLLVWLETGSCLFAKGPCLSNNLPTMDQGYVPRFWQVKALWEGKDPRNDELLDLGEACCRDPLQ